jgi:plasmid stabilization system protein ParE
MNVVFLPEARSDLLKISEYISKDLQNPIAANNIVKKILSLSDKLMNFPELGTSLEVFDARINNYRYLAAGNYLIIYNVTSSEIQITRLLYARSNYVELLGF